MPSDLGRDETNASEPRWPWLYSQGLGVVCGQLTVGLLALGSVVLTMTRDGASAMIAVDDIRGFFAAPSVAHLWFYLLLPVLGLYALNTLLATWLNVSRRWRAGIRKPHAYAAAVVHVGFLLALVAHGVGGLWSGSRGQLTLGSSWQSLGDGRRARLVSFEAPRLPDGGLKQVWARVEVRDGAGRQTTATISYNGPLSSGLGSDLLLLARPTSQPAARLAWAGQSCELEVDESCELEGAELRLLYLHPPPSPGQGALARVRVRGVAARSAEELWLTQGQGRRLADGSSLSFDGVELHPAILLHRRHAPGNPWALAAGIVMLVGLAMMWRRFLPPSRRAPEPSRSPSP